MNDKQLLMIPGPTPIPQRVLHTLGNNAVGHRTPGFSAIIKEVTAKLKQFYQTNNDLFILTSSGTGAMEAAVSNFVNAGDKVIVMENGNFAERWVKITKKFGADVQVISGEWGLQSDPAALKAVIEADTKKEIKAVFITHNETSTGMVNDVQALRAACGDHPAIFIVDSISGMAVSPLKADEWQLDVVVSGSQKAFMLPPGLAFISVSEKAWAVSAQCKNPRFYFDLQAAKKNFDEKSTTPYTPAASLIVGLQESLKMMEEEGLENIFARHLWYRNMVRAAAKALNLELLADDQSASAAVTAIKKPGEIDVKQITKIMRDKYNVIIAAGQGKMDKAIFRIGHLGYVSETDVISVIACLEMTLVELGWDIKLGTGVAAVQEIIMKGAK
jgi:aspartate aminotransferase-like enzyme